MQGNLLLDLCDVRIGLRALSWEEKSHCAAVRAAAEGNAMHSDAEGPVFGVF